MKLDVDNDMSKCGHYVAWPEVSNTFPPSAVYFSSGCMLKQGHGRETVSDLELSLSQCRDAFIQL